MHFVQRESGLCLQEASHHSLKRKWELCISEHGRGGLSHSFPHQGMGKRSWAPSGRFTSIPLNRKSGQDSSLPRIYSAGNGFAFLQARFKGSFLRSGRSSAPPKNANGSHLSIEQIWRGALSWRDSPPLIEKGA